MSIKVEEVSGAGNITNIRDRWEALWSASDRSPFLHPGWMLPFLGNARDGQAHLVAFHNGGELEALLPLVRCGWGWRLASAPRADSLDILTKATPTPDLIEAIQKWLATQGELICAEELPPGAALSRIAGPVIEQSASVCSVVNMPLALGGGKKRRLRKISYQWARRRPDAVAEHQLVTEVKPEELVEIEQTSSKLQRGISLFDTPLLRATYAKAFTGLGKAGLLLRSSVYMEGTLVAALYCLAYPQKLSTYYMAFDDQQSQTSPGVWLMIQLMQYAHIQGYTAVDLSRGPSAFKRLFADYTYQQTTRLFGAGPKFQAERMMYKAGYFIEQLRGHFRQHPDTAYAKAEETEEE